MEYDAGVLHFGRLISCVIASLNHKTLPFMNYEVTGPDNEEF
jgi:hypothetical protein